MASQAITFRGAVILSAKISNGEHAKYTQLKVKAYWTEKIREYLGGENGPIDDVGSGHGTTDLTVTLAATKMIMSPDDSKLKQNPTEIKVEKVYDFQVVPLTKDKEVIGHELRFNVDSAAQGAAAIAESFCWNVGQTTSTLKVSYDKDEQDGIDFEKAANTPGTSPELVKAGAAFGKIGKGKKGDQIPLEDSVKGDELQRRKAKAN